MRCAVLAHVLVLGVGDASVLGEVLANGQVRKRCRRCAGRTWRSAAFSNAPRASVLAVTSGTWLARTSPPRSTSACTACFLGSGLPLWTFFFLPPTNVSSLSSTLPWPPRGRAGVGLHRLADAMAHEPCRLVAEAAACAGAAWPRRPSCWRPSGGTTSAHLVSGMWERSMTLPTRTVNSSRQCVAVIPAGAVRLAGERLHVVEAAAEAGRSRHRASAGFQAIRGPCLRR